MKAFAIIGGIAVAIAAAIFAAVHFSNSPQKWIAKHYADTGYHRYHSARPPAVVAGEITRKFHPIDRVTDRGGTYLQYQKWVVATLPSGTGTDITVDAPAAGYRRYSSHVGRYWPVPGSGGWNRHGGASFRGGGSGSGK